ncbi:MAG TPA: CvpA family protein, partial [Candidatus Polarisedimenticolia bacterium]|nr:CvpA family protein [Candidatus Polarisedimenticolia bacterium]
LFGLMRGMARLVLWFAGVTIGWIAAVRYAEPLALWMGATASPSPTGIDGMRLAAFAAVFVGVVVVCSVLAFLVTRALGAVKLRWLDRLMGGGLGLLAAILLACAATIPLAALWPPDGGGLLKGSTLAPYALAGGDYLQAVAAEPLRGRFAAVSRALFAGQPEEAGPERDPNAPKPEPGRRPR